MPKPKKPSDSDPGSREGVSLSPVPFEEAVSDLLKVKKPSKAKEKAQKRQTKPNHS